MADPGSHSTQSPALLRTPSAPQQWSCDPRGTRPPPGSGSHAALGHGAGHIRPAMPWARCLLRIGLHHPHPRTRGRCLSCRRGTLPRCSAASRCPTAPSPGPIHLVLPWLPARPTSKRAMFLPSYSLPFSRSVLLMKGLLSLGLPSPTKTERGGEPVVPGPSMAPRGAAQRSCRPQSCMALTIWAHWSASTQCQRRAKRLVWIQREPGCPALLQDGQ